MWMKNGSRLPFETGRNNSYEKGGLQGPPFRYTERYMKPALLGLIAGIAVLVAGYFFMGLMFVPIASPTPTSNTYANDRFGISFTYPEGYILSEKSVATDHYAIALIREEDAVPVVAGGEGPTAVTIEVYNAEEGSLVDFLARPESNFQISDGTYASMTVAGLDALSYGWSGLYEGETTAFIRNNYVFAVSVTYRSPSDPIRAAYEEVLSSLR
jgi:hypothetical protein